MPRVSSIAFTIAATVLKPVMYLPAPPETPKITGDWSFSAVFRIAFVHSKLLMLNWPTAYLPSLAFSIISFADTNIIQLPPIKCLRVRQTRDYNEDRSISGGICFYYTAFCAKKQWYFEIFSKCRGFCCFCTGNEKISGDLSRQTRKGMRIFGMRQGLHNHPPHDTGNLIPVILAFVLQPLL